jgi:hypothetical protein
LRRLLKYVWASPATALGLVLAAIACATGATVTAIDGVLEVSGGQIGRAVSLLPQSLRFSAITFGHVIIGVSPAILAGCRGHEHVHVRQYERWGILFFPLYLSSSAWQILRGRSPYWDNHFEREAHRAAKR